VTYNRPVTAASVVLIEGDHFDAGEHPGGHFASTPTVELLIGGVWTTPPGGFSHIPAPDPTVPFEILGWTLAQPVQATGVRVLGTVGGVGGLRDLRRAGPPWTQRDPIPPVLRC
jgi:hypothetical protein